MRPSQVFLGKHVRISKHEDLAVKAEQLEANRMYASVRHKDGVEKNVSLSDVASCPQALAPRKALSAIETGSSPSGSSYVVGHDRASN